MKHKRVWSDEQRRAAAERARARFTKKPTDATTAVVELPEDQKIRSPEVQAVIDTMSPERKAKLASIQARNLAQLNQTKEGREALQRMEARHTNAPIPSVNLSETVIRADGEKAIIVAEEVLKKLIPPLVREVPMKVPFRLTGSQSGLMVSELGVCLCGEPKLKWHPVCLKVRV